MKNYYKNKAKRELFLHTGDPNLRLVGGELKVTTGHYCFLFRNDETYEAATVDISNDFVEITLYQQKEPSVHLEY